MKESIALTKWCPMSRGLKQAASVNKPWDEHLCIGDDCMMWRRIHHPEHAQDRIGDDDGYCGLAGHD